MNPEPIHEIFIDDINSDMKLIMKFDIDFPFIPCSLMYIDYSNFFGNKIYNIKDDITKQQIDSFFNEINPPENAGEYASVDQVIDDIKEKKGCKIRGILKLNHISATLQFSSSFKYNIFEIFAKKNITYYPNYNHRINLFQFGLNYFDKSIVKHFKDLSFNPLDGTQFNESSQYYLKHIYHLNVVPISIAMNSYEYASYQFNVLKNIFPTNQYYSGMKFVFEISPLHIRYEDKTPSTISFLFNLVSIIGGVFTAFRILESIIHSSISKVFKERINKLR